MQFKTLAASIMLILSSSVMADTATESKNLSSFYGSVGTINIDSQASFENQIDESAFYFKLGWEKHKKAWIWGIGISGYLYSDNASFTNNTTGGTKKSEASAVNGYLEGGYGYAVNENVSFSMITGYEHVFSSTRGIGMCTGCDSEDIEIQQALTSNLERLIDGTITCMLPPYTILT